jgi:hypothetical protein
MAKKAAKIQKTVDVEKIKSSLDNLIKERDPLQKWLPVLNELKPKIQDALDKGVSLSKVRESLANGGLRVPQNVLKEFLEGSK